MAKIFDETVILKALCRVLGVATILVVWACREGEATSITTTAMTTSWQQQALLLFTVSIYGASQKLQDLTLEHWLGSKMVSKMVAFCSTIVSAILLWKMDSFLCPTFITADIAFHMVVKAKADNRQGFLCALICCGGFVLLSGSKDAPRIDIFFVLVISLWGAVWGWVNNHWLQMGDTIPNQFRLDKFVLVSVLSAVCDASGRYDTLALMTITEHVAYATTKILSKRAASSLYIQSKREKVHVSTKKAIAVFYAMGGLLWIIVYGMMLTDCWQTQKVDLPFEVYTFYILWEVLESLGAFGADTSTAKKLVGFAFAILDVTLHIGFIMWGSNRKKDGFGFSIAGGYELQSQIHRCLHMLCYTVMYMGLFIGCFRSGRQRQLKYLAFPLNIPATASMILASGFDSSWMTKSLWLMIVADWCYAIKVFDMNVPSPRIMYQLFMVALPLSQHIMMNCRAKMKTVDPDIFADMFTMSVVLSSVLFLFPDYIFGGSISLRAVSTGKGTLSR